MGNELETIRTYFSSEDVDPTVLEGVDLLALNKELVEGGARITISRDAKMESWTGEETGCDQPINGQVTRVVAAISERTSKTIEVSASIGGIQADLAAFRSDRAAEQLAANAAAGFSGERRGRRRVFNP